MRFKIIYILFVISGLLYANLHLPLGFTPRQAMAVVMFLACVWEKRNLFLDKWFGIYLVFVTCFAISSILTGNIIDCIRYIVGFYFVAYVGYWSSIILIRKYNGAKLFISLLMIIGMVDAFVTIGQFFNLPYLTNIPSIMLLNNDNEFLEMVEEGEEAFGFSLPGIMPSDVYNGYFFLVIGVLCLYYLRDGIKPIRLIPWLITIIASYMVQQRAAFYLLLFISLFTFFKVVLSDRSKFKWLFMLAMIMVLPFVLEYLRVFLVEGHSRFNLGLSSTNRDVVYRTAFDFIRENWMWGGKYKMNPSGGASAHNLFLNAWIYGGFFGLLAILWLTVKQSIVSIKAFAHMANSQNMFCIVSGLAFMGFTTNSMLHNASIVSGDLLIWLLWGCFVASSRFKCH